MPDDVAQGSPGMVAFGDMILFIFVTGFFSLPPTWFLLKLLVATAPRTLLTAELFVATMGPVSWLAMTIMAVTTPPGGPSLQNVPQAAAQLFGLFLAFGAIPRMVAQVTTADASPEELQSLVVPEILLALTLASSLIENSAKTVDALTQLVESVKKLAASLGLGKGRMEIGLRQVSIDRLTPDDLREWAED